MPDTPAEDPAHFCFQKYASNVVPRSTTVMQHTTALLIVRSVESQLPERCFSSASAWGSNRASSSVRFPLLRHQRTECEHRQSLPRDAYPLSFSETSLSALTSDPSPNAFPFYSSSNVLLTKNIAPSPPRVVPGAGDTRSSYSLRTSTSYP